MLKRWILIVGVAVILLVSGGAMLWVQLGAVHRFAGAVLEPPTPAQAFALVDEAGKPFALDELRGKWILLTYGYTSCPDVCPLTLGNLRGVKSRLGPFGDNVRVVFVSVDPERDTPQVLNRYVKNFGSDFKGLTGSPQAIANAAKAYDVKYEIKESDSGGGYLVSHSALVYLIDPQFRKRVIYPFGVQPEEIAADLSYLIESDSQ